MIDYNRRRHHHHRRHRRGRRRQSIFISILMMYHYCYAKRNKPEVYEDALRVLGYSTEDNFRKIFADLKKSQSSDVKILACELKQLNCCLCPEPAKLTTDEY